MFDFENGHPVYILRFNAKVIALHLATLRKSLFSEDHEPIISKSLWSIWQYLTFQKIFDPAVI
jgi:hypothetical protein